MLFHGRNFVGRERSSEGAEVITPVNPITGKPLPSSFFVATDNEVDRAIKLSVQALSIPLSAELRSKFLEEIAFQLERLGDEWLEVAQQETGLSLDRLAGERTRTINQMRLFSTLVADGSWVNARIDLGDPDRRPTPKPDLRRMLTAIGPVAVFGASNFPFAYSVAGGDTASALAAGCPVIVKAHPAHPGTSEMTALAIEKAAIAVDMPEGIFSMLHGGNRVGIALIRHPGLAAAGFTGSLQGGRALMIAAASRSAPIPVHAEMGSTNPVILLPEALEIHWDSIAENLALSVTNGVGQFCTNPGLIIAVASPSLSRFKEKLAGLISEVAPGVMLTAGIKGRYSLGLEWWTQNGAEAIVSADRTEAKGARSNTAFFETTAKLFVTKHKLSDEVFGPATLLIVCSDRSELFDVARVLTGQLTASIHGEPDELVRYADLINIVTARVGRLIYNGFPTGVEVNPSMTHGGPFPATSDSRFTSVGTAAIYRFARPVTWQNAPDPQLPLELQNSNPLNVRRLVDGEFTSSKIE